MKRKLVIIIPIVILVISIISLIVSNILENKRIEEYKENVKNYISNIEDLIKQEGSILNNKVGTEIELDNEIISEVKKGDFSPSSGTIEINEKSNISKACFISTYKEENYIIKYKKEITMEKTTVDCEGVDLKISETVKDNGFAIYFNPETGKKCSEKEYKENENASKTGNTSGCMRWYVFLDEKGNSNVNLLLDHNTTALIAWTNTNNNSLGPIGDTKLLSQLKENTRNWEGIKDRTDSYTVNNENNEIYSINYEGFKARLISAEEIAKISGKEDFEVQTSNDSFYFGSNSNEDKTKRINYTWLFDGLGGCFGLCENEDSTTYREFDGVARSIMFGYWTSTASIQNNDQAWIVTNEGSLKKAHIKSNAHYGIRPVITIKKAKVY